MSYLIMKRVVALSLLLTFAGISSIDAAQGARNAQTPDLPAACEGIDLPAGNRVAFHAYASGVQIYRWTGTTWAFVEPVATLFADADHHEKVGVHYGGPTWESNSGGKVVAARLDSCSPDATAIPWLLLQAVSTEGSGVFSRVTYIQRVNTSGGLAPTAAGSSIGVVAQIPYTAEYFFYRLKN